MSNLLTKEFIADQKRHLQQLREAITGITPDDIQNEKGDFCDASQQTFEHEFALQMLSKSNNSLKLIDKALSKIEEGSYGLCELSSKPIAIERLEALPWAEYTIECQRRLEKEAKEGVKSYGFGGETHEEEDEEAED